MPVIIIVSYTQEYYKYLEKIVLHLRPFNVILKVELFDD